MYLVATILVQDDGEQVAVEADPWETGTLDTHACRSDERPWSMWLGDLCAWGNINSREHDPRLWAETLERFTSPEAL